MMCGGVGDVNEANDEVHQLVARVKPHAEKRLGASFEIFKAINYRTQLVNGVNYFIKVHVGNDRYVHLRVYKSFDASTIELVEHQADKQLADELAYF